MTAPAPHILLVEDAAALAGMYAEYLANCGYEVETCGGGREGLEAFSRHNPDLLILDLHLPDMDGMDMLRTLQEKGFDKPVLVVTGHGSVSNAVEAIRLGAVDFLVKPFNLGKMEDIIRRTLADSSPANDSSDFGRFIGTSPAIMKVYDILTSAAPSSAPVFITGEPGTERDVCAQALHKNSPRAAKPFIAINCSDFRIPEDFLLEDTDGGTLYLDEVMGLDAEAQIHLMRTLRARRDVRVVCATTRDPLEEIESGRFRRDLFYSLNVVSLSLPPLRERGEDILDIARVFLTSSGREEGKDFRDFDDDAARRLLRYAWPGNLLQLRNLMRMIAVLRNGPIVTSDMLPKEIFDTSSRQPSRGHAGPPHTKPLWAVEKETIETAIRNCAGNIPRAAALLGVSPSTIYRKKIQWEGGG